MSEDYLKRIMRRWYLNLESGIKELLKDGVIKLDSSIEELLQIIERKKNE